MMCCSILFCTKTFEINVCCSKKRSASLAADTTNWFWADFLLLSRTFTHSHPVYWPVLFHLLLRLVYLVKMGQTMSSFATERSMVHFASVANITTLRFIPSFNQCGRDWNSINTVIHALPSLRHQAPKYNPCMPSSSHSVAILSLWSDSFL
jgi:hypothetical protein